MQYCDLAKRATQHGVERLFILETEPNTPAPRRRALPSASISSVLQSTIHIAMTVHALWVINKAGGLVYNRYYSGASAPR